MNYREELAIFKPTCDQEISDKAIMLKAIDEVKDAILTRNCKLAHVTASSMILNKEHTKVLMVYHNIYQSWSWTGGHADGDIDMQEVAIKEAKEETGITHLTPLYKGLYAIDILPVWGHIKKGSYVSAHLHLNYTYLFVADESEGLQHKADENSAVKWISIHELDEVVREEDMKPVYLKMLRDF